MNAPSKIEAATLASAMAAAFGEIEGATKSAANSHFKSKYADLTRVIEAIKPALIKHSLFFTQHPEPSDKGVCVETVLHHAGGESLSLGKLFVPANKSDAQGFGSALTYARRYALVTAFGVPVEDDDGNAASNRTQGGSGQGQFGGNRQVSPTGTADNSQGRQRVAREKLDGPHTSWTALERAIKDFDRQLRSCGDGDELNAYLLTSDVGDLRAQLERDAPEYLYGGEGLPVEFEPLNGLVARLRNDFEQLATANRMVGYGRT